MNITKIRGNKWRFNMISRLNMVKLMGCSNMGYYGTYSQKHLLRQPWILYKHDSTLVD